MVVLRLICAVVGMFVWMVAGTRAARAASTPEWGSSPSDVTLTAAGINKQGPPRDSAFKCCKGGHKDATHIHPAGTIVDHYFVTIEVTLRWKRRIIFKSGLIAQRVWPATGANTDSAGWYTQDADAPTAAEIDAARRTYDNNGKQFTQLPGPAKPAGHDLFRVETRFGTTNPLCPTPGDYHYTQWPAEVDSVPQGAVRRTEKFEVKDKQGWAIFELDKAYERSASNPTVRFKTWVKVEEWLQISPPGCGGKGYSEEHLLDVLYAHDESQESTAVKGVSISMASSISIEPTEDVNAWTQNAQGSQAEAAYCTSPVCGH